MITFDEASQRLSIRARPRERAKCALGDAEGLVLAQDVSARIDAPRADLSAMDGYAVRESDWPGPFRVTGTSSAGAVEVPAIGAGEAMRIFTGAPMPDGADRVLIQEEVTRDDDTIRPDGNVDGPAFVRRKAGDFARGDVLLRAGTRLTPAALLLAAGADHAVLPVWRRPRVAILATGDELVEPGTASGMQGRLPESASVGVAALARGRGAEIVGCERRADDPAAIARAAAALMERADVLVLIGGASVGDRDFARSGVAACAPEPLFAKVAMRPGKPVWASAGADGRIALGLPGNPTSAMVTARLFLVPLLCALGGDHYDVGLQWEDFTLAADLPAPGSREHFGRAIADGHRAAPIANQLSSSQRVIAQADLLVRQPANGPAMVAGDAIRALRF
ncbi:molybdopterin molybdotransferase MoeA [Qipengyuania sp. JC766]|uniref:molybdopterin molybdotransferase MoeA n=1 Tax=Qipengyuania sp. JC766 TaxID=3232139 RepID=UPI0034578C32